MVPFVLARPSRSGFTAVSTDVLAPKLERDLAFFAARGIVLRDRKDTEMMVTFTKTTVTKGTETGTPPYDSDEKTYETVDDTPSDPDH